MKIQFLSLAAGLLLTTSLFAQSTSTRDVSGFNTVNIGGGFDQVTFVAGNKEGVVIKSSKIDPEKIETKVNGDELSIGMKKGSYSDSGKITIEVTYKSLKEVNNSGSSDIVMAGTLKADKFELNSSGSGNLKGSFDVRDFSVNISGSADVVVDGQATEQHYAISGSGDIDAGGLLGETAEVAISGSGDVDLNVSGKVRTSISGSGDVDNKGRRRN